jgi:hypothetical protein
MALRKGLRRTHGSAFVPLKARAADDFEALAAQVGPQARLVHGHFAWGLHDYLGRKARYAVLLRDPVDRTLSHYQLTNRTRAAEGRPPLDLDHFIEHPIAGNLQAALISGTFERVQLPDDELRRRALEHLKSCALVGCFDRFDAYSSALGAGVLKRRNNAGEHPTPSAQQLRRLEARTWVDRELYEAARDLS